MPPVDPTESLSRFILQKNWYSASFNRVKHAAFMPNPINGETSVFRTSGVTNSEIWNIGDREVSIKRGKPILGRADVIASSVLSRELQIIPSEPPERHANITDWPNEKSKQKQIAIELAAEANLHLK